MLTQQSLFDGLDQSETVVRARVAESSSSINDLLLASLGQCQRFGDIAAFVGIVERQSGA